MTRACVLLSLAFVLLGAAGSSIAATPEPAGRLEPLPLDVAASANIISAIALSPDGAWLAYEYEVLGEALPAGRVHFTSTGTPVVNEVAARRLRLVEVATGNSIFPGSAESASWSPAWSPDGSRLAFYSDAGGEAGVWVWDATTRVAHRVEGITARSYFSFHDIRWLPDGQRLVVRALPAGQSIAEANARADGAGPCVPADQQISMDGPGVTVMVADARTPARSGGESAFTDIEWAKADLVLLDLHNGQTTRFVQDTYTQSYRVSPDGRHIAYTAWKGWNPTTQENYFDLVVYDIPTGKSFVRADSIGGWTGTEWSWSPDSRALAYLAGGPGAKRNLSIVLLPDGPALKVPLASATGRPYWNRHGLALHVVADGNVWRVDTGSGERRQIGGSDGRRATHIIGRRHSPISWSGDGEDTLWVAFTDAQGHGGLERIDVATGQAGVALAQAKNYFSRFDASDESGDIVFVADDAGHLPDVWRYSTLTGNADQVTRANPDYDRYRFGKTTLIEWTDRNGQTLRGTLLLPSDYREGQRVPLVVWVYGGMRGSEYVNRFGVAGYWANLQVLATRGYAVFFPDAPQRVGTPMADLASAVLPGVDAVVAAGYADPDRLAVMGHSYGSYSALALITATDRFKAAIISAVVNPDLAAGYLHMGPDGIGNTGYYESGQGGMGVPLWDDIDRYIANSPIFQFDRIHTPVLIAQGMSDFLPLQNAKGVFVALKRLGKPVELRIYEGERHVVLQKANVIDWWKRRLAFLAEHLAVPLATGHRRTAVQNRAMEHAGLAP